jgi:hypothetical protein
MCEDRLHGTWPVLFPDLVGHDAIGSALTAAYPGIKLTSAGFCTAKGNVYGESVTIKLKSFPEDALWIRQTLGIKKGE